MPRGSTFNDRPALHDGVWGETHCSSQGGLGSCLTSDMVDPEYAESSHSSSNGASDVKTKSRPLSEIAVDQAESRPKSAEKRLKINDVRCCPSLPPKVHTTLPPIFAVTSSPEGSSVSTAAGCERSRWCSTQSAVEDELGLPPPRRKSTLGLVISVPT